MVLLNWGIQMGTKMKIATCQVKEVEKLISGTEIDLAELETRANQAQILKVCLWFDISPIPP
jgi:hypothetical protein